MYIQIKNDLVEYLKMSSFIDIPSASAGAPSSLDDVLKKYFNYSTFRNLQKDIIEDMMAGNDMLILMPTGAGKSICYQLPAIIEPGLTVVISPLISLIYDQIADLKLHGIKAHYLCSTSPVNMYDVFDDVRKGEVKLLYTTPETFNKNTELSRYLNDCRIQRFIIDEAHCLSNWGHDFRSEYLRLDMRGQFPDVPICGFTATATKLVCADIIERMKLKNPLMWMTSYVKPNISYQVALKEKNDWGYIVQVVSKFIRSGGYLNESGIVYCLSRKQCEMLATALTKYDISAGFYHASMTPDKKNQVQQDWLDGKLKVIVATIAFALGINKPNVRFVIHTSMPNSIESYYQQAGRAGRDGKPSVALMYYSAFDKDALEGMIDYSQQSKESPVTPFNRIGQMFKFCCNREDCLKMQLSNYLGEYNVNTCLKRGDTSPCQVCSKIKIKEGLPVASSVSKILSIIGNNKVDLQKLYQSATNMQDYRAVNYLLNTQQLETTVVGKAGKWTEYVWLKG